MRRSVLAWQLGIGLSMLFAACADSGEGGSAPPDPDSAPEAAAPDATSVDAEISEVDASALRCHRGLCLIELPNASVHGLSKWAFAGVAYDPLSGVWAIANGAESDVGATAQILRLENGVFHVVDTPRLTVGPDKLAVRLLSLTADGAGSLIAVGVVSADGSGVIARGNGSGPFTVERFPTDLRAAWSAAPGETWIVGHAGAIFHSTTDGGWLSESIDAGDFGAVWGSGPGHLYVGGRVNGGDEPPKDDGGVRPPEDGGIRPPDGLLADKDGLPSGTHGYLGHRTTDDAGGARWSFRTFPELQTDPTKGSSPISAGVAPRGGARFWSSDGVLARSIPDGGGSDELWTRDPFEPPAVIRAFWARADRDVWAVGDFGRVYRYDGSSWKDASIVLNGAPIVSNLTAITGAITGASAGAVIIVGDDVALRSEAP